VNHGRGAAGDQTGLDQPVHRLVCLLVVVSIHRRAQRVQVAADRIDVGAQALALGGGRVQLSLQIRDLLRQRLDLCAAGFQVLLDLVAVEFGSL
jgi:hypothetical protein